MPTSIIGEDIARGVNNIDLSNAANYNITNVNFNPADSADVFKTARINAKRGHGAFLPLSPSRRRSTFRKKPATSASRYSWQLELRRARWRRQHRRLTTPASTTSRDPQYASGPFLFGTPQVPYPDPYSLHSLFVKNPSYFALASAANPTVNSATNSKYFREVISAAYIMADARMFANRLRMSGGVRFERTQEQGLRHAV